MNIGAKIIKFLANQIMTKWGLFQEYRVSLAFEHQLM